MLLIVIHHTGTNVCAAVVEYVSYFLGLVELYVLEVNPQNLVLQILCLLFLCFISFR